MANLWIDGLARYGGTLSHMTNGSSSQAWAEVDPAAFALSTANPRTGTHCLRLAGGASSNRIARRVFGANKSEVFFGFALHCFNLPSSEPQVGVTEISGLLLASFRDESNLPQCEIYLGTDGSIIAFSGYYNSAIYLGTLLGRSIPCVGAGSYHHIEIYAKAGSVDGAIEVRVDEITRLNVTGVNTIYSGENHFAQVSLGHWSDYSVPTFEPFDFADFFANDTVNDGSGCNTFVGDCKAGNLAPNGDTATAGFLLSGGGTGYTLLDEFPPNDADYIYTDATTARSDFQLEATPSATTEILAVRPWIRASKDDAGTATVAPNMVSNSVDGTVSGQPIATAPAYYDSLVALDPNTAAPWTKAALDAANEIVERTA